MFFDLFCVLSSLYFLVYLHTASQPARVMRISSNSSCMHGRYVARLMPFVLMLKFDNSCRVIIACRPSLVTAMGLLTIIRKNKMKEREMRILFLGLDNAGKTTILKRLKGQDVMSTSPTLGFEISTITYGKYLLNIWDVGGQRTLRPYWRNYFEQTDVLVWVVDSGDRLRMDDCREELHALLQEQRLAGASLLVFANKQDITGSMSDAEIKEALDLPAIRSHHWKIQPCSAVTGENVRTGLEWAVSDVAQRVYWGVIEEKAPNATISPQTEKISLAQ
ncbi:unnamed protein product [Rhizoctonia solani]|uniref:ADP-ribosylation factor-like protein 2 n=1 Tax=Rhizoctonia solani TaxID=456999 RepID=A0A8H3DP54_9AGAM|nr:unnamed protein product [Rhizoctonia solani]